SGFWVIGPACMVGTESSAIAAMVAMGCFMRPIWHRRTPGLLPVGSNNSCLNMRLARREDFRYQPKSGRYDSHSD
ncbi:MAG: hypothetical protein ACOYM3_34895, partial [Terrimicrobiaceae bacterium]